MGNGLSNVQFQAGASLSGTPTSLLQTLLTAAQGGSATYDFYSGETRARTQLAQLVGSQGSSAWQEVDDAGTLGYSFLTAGQPAYVATGLNGDCLIVQAQLSPDVMQQDSTDWAEAGVAEMWMVTDQSPVDVFTTTIEKIGPSIAATALAPAILTLLGAFKNFVTSFFTEVSSAVEAGATDSATIAESAAETAAEDAAVDGEIVADELAVSVSFGPLAVVGLVVAAITIVLMILAFGLAKTMTAWIRFFNATPYDIQLNVAYGYDLQIVQQPQSGAIPAMGAPPAPPGVTPTSPVIYRADYVVQNESEVLGLGITLQSPPTGDSPGFTFTFDIPSVGHNSMAAVGDGTVDPEDFYTSNEGAHHGLALSTAAGDATLYVGTNQNSGESPSPLSGDDGFNYEYVMVLTTTT